MKSLKFFYLPAVLLVAVFLLLISANSKKNKIAGVDTAAIASYGKQLPTGNNDQPPARLRDVYKDYFPIGAAVLPYMLDKPGTATLLANQFSSLSAINDMKPPAIQPVEGQFNWKDADHIVQFATKNNMKVRGHCLIWYANMPSWFYKDANGNLVSKDVLLARMEKHIKTVVNHFKGSNVYCWDVVNEAIANYNRPFTPFRPTDTLYKIAGEDYFKMAFKYAHEADPSAQLFLNETGFEETDKRKRIFDFVKRMKDEGVPIDGIGIQGHWGIEGIPEDYLQETIDMFAGIGLKVQITELDISIYPMRGAGGQMLKAADVKSYSDIYSSLVQQQQTLAFDRIFSVCRRNRGKVTGITLWGAYDKTNFLTKKWGKKNYPYLFDENLKPKLPFFKITKIGAQDQ